MSNKELAIIGLREWLRSENRLGIAHVGVPLPTLAPPKRQAAPGAPATKPVRPQPMRRPQPEPVAMTAARPQRIARKPITVPEREGLPPICTKKLNKADAIEALTELNNGFVKDCTHCELCQNRTKTVFGAGHPRPKLVFVGEGPGADEDRQGIPFVGRAGQLLTKMIEAMTLTRDKVFIGNIVKCRPPGNRTPTELEMTHCAPYLWRQLAILRPKVIVTLGAPSSQTLLATKTPIGRLRGQFHDFPPPELEHIGMPKCKLMPTYHPAYLLRSPGEKGKTWDDLKQVMGLLDLEIPQS